MVIEKAKYFDDEIKITDKCTYSDGWLRNLKNIMTLGNWILAVTYQQKLGLGYILFGNP
jgi:hypothetical protein